MAGWVAPAIAAGGSILGNLFGGGATVKAQKLANDTNLQINREANQNQYQMFQEQNAFNERMWHQMNEYNTPAAQMQRFTDAGINPYIAAGDVQTGNAQSALQSAPAPQQHVASVMPASGMGDAIRDSASQVSTIIGQYAQNALALAQAKKTDAEASWIDRLNSAQLGKVGAETLNLHNQNSLLGLDYQLRSDTLGNYIKLSDLSVANAQKTNEQLQIVNDGMRIENALKSVNLGIQSKYGEQMFKATLSKVLAEKFATVRGVYQRDRQLAIDKQNADTNSRNASVNAFNAQTNRRNSDVNAAVSSAQIRSIVAGAVETSARTTGLNIDNETKSMMNRRIIEGLGLDNIDKANKNKAFWWNFGLDSAEKFSRIGVNGSQMYRNVGDGTKSFVSSLLPFF